jgi:hypothetical protein
VKTPVSQAIAIAFRLDRLVAATARVPSFRIKQVMETNFNESIYKFIPSAGAYNRPLYKS